MATFFFLEKPNREKKFMEKFQEVMTEDDMILKRNKLLHFLTNFIIHKKSMKLQSLDVDPRMSRNPKIFEI